ncbi:hypothetical protein C0995_010710 [Termitomyces sp. Mi166|nr:hypothetical protein C0995_010710 [Termitomyces sp. Mi166\
MQPRPKIRRKPPPAVDAGLDARVRYPAPDPNDPFAPLWVLRSRDSSNSLKAYDPVAFPIIHDAASDTSNTTADTDKSHNLLRTPDRPKSHNALLRTPDRPKSHNALLRTPPSIPPSSSASTTSSFVHVSTPVSTEWSLPTLSQLTRAASLPVIAASGLRVPFASLFAPRPTIVVFIRHFWCPHCQDYLSSIAQTAPRPSEKNPFNLVIISNGAPAFISKYRALFGFEFEMYTDPTLAVYTALGMGRSSSASGPTIPNGDYVRHGTMGGIAMVALRALKVGLPVWERGGDLHQLGGEFILGPGLTCSYAHRMQSPKGHAPIGAVLSAAGIDIPSSDSSVPTPAPNPPSPSTPKLLAALCMKGWSPQKRSCSLGISVTTTTTTVSTPSSTSKLKFRANRNKNMSPGTYSITSLGSPTKTSESVRAESPTPSPINEFGVWRRTARVSFDSSRALSEGARRNLSFNTPPHPQSVYGYPSCSPYASGYYQRHRQYASTSMLPMYPSSPLFPSYEDERESGEYGHGDGYKGEGEQESHLVSPAHDADHEDKWMHARMASLEAMRVRKRERRAGFVGYYVPQAGGAGACGETQGKRSPVPVGCEPVKEAEEEAEGGDAGWGGSEGGSKIKVGRDDDGDEAGQDRRQL